MLLLGLSGCTVNEFIYEEGRDGAPNAQLLTIFDCMYDSLGGTFSEITRVSDDANPQTLSSFAEGRIRIYSIQERVTKTNLSAELQLSSNGLPCLLDATYHQLFLLKYHHSKSSPKKKNFLFLR